MRETRGRNPDDNYTILSLIFQRRRTITHNFLAPGENPIRKANKTVHPDQNPKHIIYLIIREDYLFIRLSNDYWSVFADFNVIY